MTQALAVTHLLLFLRLLGSPNSADWIIVYPKVMLAIGILLSLAALFGRKYSEFLLFGVVLVWLSVSNLAIRNVSQEILLWVTIANVFKANLSKIKLSDDLYSNGLWFFFGINYCFSGIDKLKSAQWVNGEALDIIMTTHAANLSFYSDLLRALPLTALMSVLTHSLHFIPET